MCCCDGHNLCLFNSIELVVAMCHSRSCLQVCGRNPSLPGLYRPHGGSQGMIDYRDIKKTYPNLKEYYDPYSKASYGYDAASGVFVSYDSAQVISDKAAYLKQQGLGGFMFWVLGADDDQNTLLTAISRGLRGGSSRG